MYLKADPISFDGGGEEACMLWVIRACRKMKMFVNGAEVKG